MWFLPLQIDFWLFQSQKLIGTLMTTSFLYKCSQYGLKNEVYVKELKPDQKGTKNNVCLPQMANLFYGLFLIWNR